MAADFSMFFDSIENDDWNDQSQWRSRRGRATGTALSHEVREKIS